MTEFPQYLHTVLDAVDVRALAEYYRQLLGLKYRDGDGPPADGVDEADWLVLVTPAGQRVLAFQRVRELPRSTWPSTEVPMQVHVDFAVTSHEALDGALHQALALGGTLLLDRRHDGHEPLVVIGDPAGHPFCILAR